MSAEIICNTRCLQASTTGVQRYTKHMLEGFPTAIKTISPSVHTARGMQGHLWEQMLLPKQTRNKLLWSPSNSGPVGAVRQVVTIHDVVSFDHPEWLNKAYVKWYDYVLPRVCKRAEHLIAISNFTKQRIMELFRIPDSKITVIYNGSDPMISVSPTGQGPALPFSRFVLSLGSLEPRKNIPMLLAAWLNVLPFIPDDVGLVIVGTSGNSQVFNKSGIGRIPGRVHFTGHLPDEDIAWLYRNALLFTYLSVYEGFGLPPLEAMSAGVPVLSGNLTAMPEVQGDAGYMIDPFSLSECEKALIELINNDDLRKQLAVKSSSQAAKFSWQKSAQSTFNVLQRFV